MLRNICISCSTSSPLMKPSPFKSWPRSAIAKAGYERTLREHTYAHRFEEIFRAMGLAHLSPHEQTAGQMRPGATLEIR